MANKVSRQKDADDIYSLFVMSLKDKLADDECQSQVLKLALEFLKHYYVDQPATSIEGEIKAKVNFPYQKVK